MRLYRTWCGRSITSWISFSITEEGVVSQQEKFDRLLQKYPQDRPAYFERPHCTRRRFFQLAGGVTGSFLAQRCLSAAEGRGAGAAPKNTAKNVIFILL